MPTSILARPLARALAGAALAESLGLCAAIAESSSVTFSQSATIGCDDTTWEGYDVTVTGPATVLTVDCEHVFASLTLLNGAKLVHSAGQEQGMALTILGDAVISLGTSIDVRGLGYPAGAGPGVGVSGVRGQNGGGGGHGGAGGDGADQNAFGGRCYGSIEFPTTPGSGGGAIGSGTGAGGGAVRLDVGGKLLLDGAIRADGHNNAVVCGGAGAGGSIWITCAEFAGGASGVASANGGSGACAQSGGGGGGRIAIHAKVDSFNGVLRAFGGSGNGIDGGNGTIYTRSDRAPAGRLLLANNGNSNNMGAELSGATVFEGDVHIGAGGVLSHPHGEEGFHLHVLGDMTIEPLGAVNADGRGHGPGQGPGAGATAVDGVFGGGGGHGGAGGDGQGVNAFGGSTYGVWSAPTSLGSGGGAVGADGGGGAGGGAIRLTVDGTLTVNGAIRAEGRNNAGSCAGAGAGGSIWITCKALAGSVSGLIAASGGSGACASSGGGGGGRIAIHAPSNSFPGVVRAYGGSGFGADGGNGTIYTVSDAHPRGQLLIANNGNLNNMGAEFSGDAVIFGDLRVQSGGLVTHAHGDVGLHLHVFGDVIVSSGAAIAANGRGFPAEQGPGAGVADIRGTAGGGGGHGGSGGAGAGVNAFGGQTYAAAEAPTQLGSGGGHISGGAGGGAIRLTATGAVTVNGSIRADGASNAGGCGGGGSGGSLWITAESLEGNGVISAAGGSGACGASGGGGGGRIALFTCTDPFPSGVVSVSGGQGFVDGEDGSVYIQTQCGAEVLISSSGPGEALPIAGDLAAQIAAANAGPPFGGSWVPVHAHDDCHAPSSFVCAAQIDQPVCDPLRPGALRLPYVSANDFIDGAAEVTLDNCGAAFYRFTFALPPSRQPILYGVVNADDAAVAWLNGHRISAMIEPGDLAVDRADAEGLALLGWPTRDVFGNADPSHFRSGLNELVFAVVGDLSEFDPTGVEFEAVVRFAPGGILGDIDGDGVVAGADLGLLLAAWSTGDRLADLDGDGMVDGADLGLLLAAWTQ